MTLAIIRENFRRKLTQNPRGSRAALTGVTTLVTRGISVGTGLLSIPITAQYLGEEQFGVWVLLSTFVSWITLADLGLTSSLVNVLATAIAKGDGKAAKQSVASAFFPMVLLGILLLSLSIQLSFFVHWEEILNLRTTLNLQQDIRWAITVSMCIFALRLPLSIPRCIYTSYQEGYIYQLWMGLANILSLLSLFIAQSYQANLPWLIGVFFGVVMLGDLLAGIHIFYFRHRWLKPRFVDCDFDLFKGLLKIGFQFWIAQICAICILQTDLIVVSQLFGVAAVGIYGVLLKLFSTMEAMSTSFVSPLWPAYNEAKVRGDYKWISKTFRNSIVFASVWSVCAGGMLAVLTPSLLSHWLGKNHYYSPELPFYMLLTYALLAVGQCVAMLLNGLGRLRLQSFIAPISAVSNILLSFILGKTIGIGGVTLATSICILLFSIVLLGFDALIGVKEYKLSLSNHE